jgi:cyclin H
MSVASAFLASKIEDCMLDVRYLELATKEMDAPVGTDDILKAEVQLLKGCDFDLLMFHPYKTVLACTEDLRVYLKSERGRGLAVIDDGDRKAQKRQVAGEDLRPMHDMAMKICDDIIVSDIPLLYGPGEVGLAALMVATEYVCNEPTETLGGQESTPPQHTTIDVIGYIRSRFQDSTTELKVKIDSSAIETVVSRVTVLRCKIRELKEGKHGCGNHQVDMESLKAINKKLKKCRAWGQDISGGKKKKKKRKAEE